MGNYEEIESSTRGWEVVLPMAIITHEVASVRCALNMLSEQVRIHDPKKTMSNSIGPCPTENWADTLDSIILLIYRGRIKMV